jgi:hypothetical protein
MTILRSLSFSVSILICLAMDFEEPSKKSMIYKGTPVVLEYQHSLNLEEANLKRLLEEKTNLERILKKEVALGHNQELIETI